MENFSNCPTKLNCIWYNERDMYLQKNKKLQEQLEELKKTKEIMQAKSLGIDSESKFEQALNSEIVQEKTVEIFKFQLKITEMKKENETVKTELENSNKQLKYYRDVFDRDLHLQELDKKYKLLLYDYQKLESKNNTIEDRISISKQELISINSIYNEKIDEHKKVSKAVHDLRKELTILKKKKIKDYSKLEKVAKPKKSIFSIFQKKPKPVQKEDKININLEPQENKIPPFRELLEQNNDVLLDLKQEIKVREKPIQKPEEKTEVESYFEVEAEKNIPMKRITKKDYEEWYQSRNR